jgi:hypothetical protein
MKPYIRVIDNVATRGEDGRGPAVHVAVLQDGLHTRPSRFTIPIRSPYPIVGGRLWCTLVKEGASSLDQAAIFFGQPGWEGGNLFTFRWDKGTKEVEMDLDSLILRESATHQYVIGFNLRGNARANPPTQAGLARLRSVTDVQLSPHSLPALQLGRNVVRISSQSDAPLKLRITHRWREVADRQAPEAVSAAVNPADGATADGLAPLLRWQAVPRATDHQVMVSLRPDCRWPLASTLHQNTGSGQPEWKVPAGFLNPGTTYYWKVRARDGEGLIGGWSRVFSFRTSASYN